VVGLAGHSASVTRVKADPGMSEFGPFLDRRPEIRTARLAYNGLNSGATVAPLILTLEPRFKAGILIGGGRAGSTLFPSWTPELCASRACARTRRQR